jgi:hypothetical protein
MSDFVLGIHGDGRAIALEPQGTIDLEGAQTLLETVGSLRGERHALLAIDLEGVTGLTREAWRLLATSELPVEVLASGGG